MMIVVSGYFGKKLTGAYRAPQLENCFFFSNNSEMKSVVENQGWTFLYEHIPVSSDSRISSLQSKYVKFLQFDKNKIGWVPGQAILYFDHKLEVKKEHIEKIKRFCESHLLIRNTPKEKITIQDEIDAALGQKRYAEVMGETVEWVKNNPRASKRNFNINWFHLGADIDQSLPTKGFLQNEQFILDNLKSKAIFLMVGTLEPRKGHAQVLGAFEKLWQDGADLNLIIVGKKGWLVDVLEDRLRKHKELGKRLFWLEGASDEFLTKIYATSTCLIAASYGEGFGLPLIEAAKHKLPIICRDIPVFREVASEHAFYFDASDAIGL
jgi:glycosyltransferase involved in cell wall biosynthesis